MSIPQLFVVVLAAVAVAGGMWACDESPSASSSTEGPQSTLGKSMQAGQRAAGAIGEAQAAAAGAADLQTGVPGVSVAGVRFGVPEGWSSVPPANTMRAGEMHVPTDAGQCLVTFSTAGGDVQANIQRWAGQFKSDDAPVMPRRSTRTVSGLHVTEVQLEGTYMDGMAASATPRPDYMLRGAIIESPRGLVFVKMTGPVRAMDDAAGGWTALIAGMQAE